MLSHFAKDLKELDRTRTYLQGSTFKPVGFWVSVEDDGKDGWSSWCRDNDYATESLPFENEVILWDDAIILRISTAEELDAFTKEYCIDPTQGWQIDWNAVAEAYQGILIENYIWSRRMMPHTMWYYGWDCASGCIWDLTAIKKISPISKEQYV